MRKRLIQILIAFPIIFYVSEGISAQTLDKSRLDSISENYAGRSYDLLREILSIPNDAHFPEHVRRNVEWCETAFQRRGFSTTRLDTGGPPLLLAERKAEKSSRTVLIYLQIDGQPVDPSKWFQPDPYRPVLKEKTGGEWKEIPWGRLKGHVNPEWRVFARSASDAKGPVAMFLTALDAMEGEKLPQLYDIKIIMDFEEEMGSPHLPAAVEKHKDALAADMLIIFDGPRHISNRPTLDFGARGIADVTLTVFGPRQPQHSGHYGNYAPNPALRLSQLLASMKDADGRVTIPGFYDDVKLDDKTRAILAQTPDDEGFIRKQLGIAEIDKVGTTLQEAIQFPSINIRGMSSGWVGKQKRTIIPDTATVELDVRLVPETDAERLIGLIRKYIESQGYHIIGDREPTEDERMRFSRIISFTYSVSYGAFRTPYDTEVAMWLNRAMVRAFGEEPVRIRMAGGSIPISPFVVKLGLPAVSVPTVNKDNNQHSPNENLRIGNYIEGVKTFLAILTQKIEDR